MITHHVFEGDSSSPLILFIKESAFNPRYLEKHYINDLRSKGVTAPIIAYSLEYQARNKVSAKFMTQQREEVIHRLIAHHEASLVIFADSNYFKHLTKQKPTSYIGDIFEYPISPLTFIPNYQALVHNPNTSEQIQLGLDQIAAFQNGTFKPLSEQNQITVKHFYKKQIDQIIDLLKYLESAPQLAVDVETYDLKAEKAGIATIAFATDQHNAYAIEVALNPQLADTHEGRKATHHLVSMLKNFFTGYQGKLIFHNASFDVKILIRWLFMKHITDQTGLLEGIDTFYEDRIEDTKIISYLATNSTAGNNLGLKHLAYPYMGAWAEEDIHDVTKIPLDELLTYNGKDTVATNYVFDTYYSKMVEDNQLEVYESVFKPALIDIIQMELTGMPINLQRVSQLNEELSLQAQQLTEYIRSNADVQQTEWMIKLSQLIKDNAEYVNKVNSIDDYADFKFNPNSGQQVAKLLHDVWGLPVIETTDTGAPSTSRDTLKKHINHLKEQFGITDEDL